MARERELLKAEALETRAVSGGKVEQKERFLTSKYEFRIENY